MLNTNNQLLANIYEQVHQMDMKDVDKASWRWLNPHGAEPVPDELRGAVQKIILDRIQEL